jgi:hypothetical protein
MASCRLTGWNAQHSRMWLTRGGDIGGGSRALVELFQVTPPQESKTGVWTLSVNCIQRSRTANLGLTANDRQRCGYNLQPTDEPYRMGPLRQTRLSRVACFGLLSTRLVEPTQQRWQRRFQLSCSTRRKIDFGFGFFHRISSSQTTLPTATLTRYRSPLLSLAMLNMHRQLESAAHGPSGDLGKPAEAALTIHTVPPTPHEHILTSLYNGRHAAINIITTASSLRNSTASYCKLFEPFADHSILLHNVRRS